MRKKVKIILIALACLFIILAFVFYLYIQHRTGPDYEGHFAELLPPETAAYASLENLEALWNKTSSLDAYKEIMESRELASLLLTSEELRNWKRQLTELEYKTRLELGKDFVLKWLGTDVALAVLPPLKTNSTPAILIMSRTRMGFEEKLAEFVAQYYPDLHLQSEHYQGTRINRFIGEDTNRCFSYLRFGRTVFLSLRSPETSILEDIIKRRHNKDLSSLMEREDFQTYLSGAGVGGSLSGFFQAEQLLSFLRASQEKSDSETLREYLPVISRVLSPYRCGEITFRLEKSLTGKARFSYQNPLMEPPPSPPVRFISLDKLSPGICGFVGMKDRRLGQSLEWLSGLLVRNEPRQKDEPDWGREIHQLLAGNVYPSLQDELVISLRGMAPGFVSPLFDGDLFLEVKDPGEARKAMQKTFEEYGAEGTATRGEIRTPPGTIRYDMEGDFLHMSIRGQEDLHEQGEKSIESHPLFQALFPGDLGGSNIAIYINFERVGEDLGNLAKRSIRWSDKTRRRIKRFEKWSGVCRYLGGLALWDGHDRESVSYEMRVGSEW